MVIHAALIALAACSQFSGGMCATASSPEVTSRITADSSPIRKVITLIEEMKAQVEKDASNDEAAHDKYMCWCKTNEEAKTHSIAEAERHIEDLTALLEELTATESRLKTEIAGLAQDIADDQDALATAQATREKEFVAFQAEETDLKETRGLLIEAVQTLSKVQLLQKEGSGWHAEASHAKTALLQLQGKVVLRNHPTFQSLMKRDLFEVLGSLAESFPTSAFLPKKSAAFVERKGSLLPWEKTDEQVGMESKPNELEGAAANSKSYNSRSGRILGLLAEMRDETARDLGEAQRNDFRAEVSFQQLRAAKLGEIAVAQKQKKRKEANLADTLSKAAESREDLEVTQEALAADQSFLANMLKDCSFEDDEYSKRKDIRSKELVAISETIRILTEDDARGLYAKTISFLQTHELTGQSSLDHRADRAMQRLAVVARKHKNWALVSLAVRVRLDAFTKVKEAMDKMLAELAKQQKEEYAKWESCKSNIDETEDSIKVGEQVKEDLDEKHKFLVGSIETLNHEIKALQQEEGEMEVSLKEAGEQRKEQNQVFQTSVVDQRATTNILNKALTRLKAFYTPELLQAADHPDNTPGRAVAPPPPKGRAYSKSAGAGGVIQLLMMVIKNSETEEKQLELDEQRSQQLYSELVSSTAAAIEADRAAIEEKSVRRAKLMSVKSDTEAEQLANDGELSRLGDLLKAHHLECDYILNYFDVRQQARAEEIDAITDAKAVLSGANFGK